MVKRLDRLGATLRRIIAEDLRPEMDVGDLTEAEAKSLVLSLFTAELVRAALAWKVTEDMLVDMTRQYWRDNMAVLQ